MELLLLNENFEEIKRVDEFHSLIWNEKYNEIGRYELHLLSDGVEELQKAKYLYRNDIKRLALIYDIDYELTNNADENLSISGNFIEDILNNEVFEKEKTYIGTHSDIARQIISEYFPNLRIKNSNLGKNTTIKFDGEYIGNALNDFLKTEELSYRIEYDYLTNDLIFEIYKGLDRTENQQFNEWVIFSDENETISNIRYSKSLKDYKNYAVITGDGEKTSPFTVILDKSNGEIRRKLRVKAYISRKNGNSIMGESEYRKTLEQKGIEELEKHKIIEVIESDTINIDYRKDYNLGDLCTFKINRLNILTYKRAIEIEEVFESGNKEIKVKFGKDFINLTQIIRR